MKKPKGIDERPEQLRPAIIKEQGVTETERYLGQLAEKSFLNLWCYPSPYRDQKSGGSGDGKELCDLLVVCGEHIIIFSEKNISWPSGDLGISWNRWFRKAVFAAAKQAKGAERWILEHPDRIFLDRSCLSKFPIEFPALDVRKVHRVVVARGAAQKCNEHCPGSSGSLIITPNLRGKQHCPKDVSEVRPFEVGDVDPDGSFVHVLDDVTLDIVMQELNTIRDFTDYLQRKEAFIRSGKLEIAHGEENLLAYYATRIGDDGDHDFVLENSEVPITIDRSHYGRWVGDPRYLAKQQADRISFLWDDFITLFTTHMLDGTSVVLDDFEFELKRNELAVRCMALEPRLRRRYHGQAILGALKRGEDEDIFFRLMIIPEDAKENETAFFIMTFKYQDWMEEKGGYEQYRRVRTERAIVYANGILEKFPHIQRIVGISREPPGQDRGISEDLVYAEQNNWSEDERADIRGDCEALGVLQNSMRVHHLRGEEYPEMEELVVEQPLRVPLDRSMNRQQRRAAAARRRRMPTDSR